MTEQTTGYCPACGRGDVAPTPDEYEKQRQRAEQAEAKVADYENRITWETNCGSCARILDSAIRETERAERAEAALAEARGQIERVRKVIAERQTEVSEREAGGMLPFGTPGASWCDAVTVTCARVEDALKVFPPAVGIPCPPDHNAGPTVAECAANDRRWPLEKAGE